MRQLTTRATSLAVAVLIAGCAPGSQAEGLSVARDAGCQGCHTESDTSVGPTWVDLWGSRVELEDGTTITADELYIRESIVDPHVKIVKGYGSTMPLVQLTDDDVDLLVSYIRSLS